MQQLRNKLNNVKTVSENSSKSEDHDIMAESAFEILSIISEDTEITNKKVLIINSQNGIIPIGVGILKPDFSLVCSKNNPSNLLISNMKQHGLSLEYIIGSRLYFIPNVFDICIICPILDKSKLTSTTCVSDGIECSKSTFVVFHSEHSKLILEKYTSSRIIGSTLIKLPGSSKYSKQNTNHVRYDIIKMK